jgi:hypothetical protein
MISRSGGHCGKLLLLSRVAGRSTPMIGTDRSKLSCLTLLFLFVLMGMPMAARCDSLEDSARELARKIAAVVTARGEMSCEIQNVSSLQLDDVIRIDQALKAELQGRCVRSKASGSESANLVIKLSENMKGLLWTAEIHQASGNQEILQVAQLPGPTPASTNALPALLRSEKFWDGRQHILDAGLVTATNGDQLVILLVPDAVLIQNVSRRSEIRIDLPLGIPTSTSRDPSAALYLQVGNIIAARHSRRYCTISLDTLTFLKCWDYEGEEGIALGPASMGGQVVSAPTNCTKNRGIPWFVTGIGDDTQPDTLRLEVYQNLGSMIASNQVDFPGPILAIHSALNDMSSTIIVRNVHTGNYEAYRLSISCAQ